MNVEGESEAPKEVTIINKIKTPRLEHAWTMISGIPYVFILAFVSMFFAPHIILGPFHVGFMERMIFGLVLSGLFVGWGAYCWYKGVLEKRTYTYYEMNELCDDGTVIRELWDTRTKVPIDTHKYLHTEVTRIIKETDENLKGHLTLFQNGNTNHRLLITPGFTPEDAMQLHADRVNGKWSRDIGKVSRFNLVKKLPEPYKSNGIEIPIYVLSSSEKMARLFGGGTDLLKRIDAKELVRLSSEYGKYQGQKFRHLYESVKGQLDQLIEAVKDDNIDSLKMAKDLALGIIRRFYAGLSKYTDVDEKVVDRLGKKGVIETLFGTRKRAMISISTLTLIVLGIIAFFVWVVLPHVAPPPV